MLNFFFSGQLNKNIYRFLLQKLKTQFEWFLSDIETHLIFICTFRLFDILKFIIYKSRRVVLKEILNTFKFYCLLCLVAVRSTFNGIR